MSTIQNKPQLRNLHTSQIKRNLVGMMIISVSAAFATYDAEKQLKIMNDAGLMQSFVPPQK
ncbi:Cytochrome c oxidase subunit 6C [Temnothorax longispinosus]|uniref:Cytochrome c oxidase subunit 6C n=1 Tax=Temnothorax longispinosus TaxID=300112 RepID=A0A4S2KGK6_9HYME|nr:Cytochrome c oxidase subunit 6C [Temnothorax longispinosus]